MNRNIFFAGIAACALSVGSAEAAEPIKLSLGGTLVENFGYVENNGLNRSDAPSTTKVVKFHEQDDGTLMFKGSTTLDNGVRVSANIDIYATAGNPMRGVNNSCGKSASVFTPAASTSTCAGNVAVKRAYAMIQSKYGALILGEREDATYIVHNSAPDVSPLSPIGDGYWYWWVVDPAQHRNLVADNDSWWDGRTNKITYVSPSFHGLAAAFTYIPSISTSNGSGSIVPATSSDAVTYVGNGSIIGANYGGDAYGGGLAYSDSIHGVAVKADATVVQANVANLRLWQQGLQVAYAGFTLGGSSLIRDVPHNATVTVPNIAGGVTNVYTNAVATLVGGPGATPAAVAQAAAYGGNTYTIGLSYAIGPYAVSAAFLHDNSKSLKSLNGTGQADSTDVYSFGAAYTAGPGIILRAGVGYVDYRGSQANSAASWLNNNDGVIVVTGLKLDF